MSQENRETFREKRTKNAQKRAEITSKRLYCVFTSSLLLVYWFLLSVRHLELSTYKVTKNVRETSDMAALVSGQQKTRTEQNFPWNPWNPLTKIKTTDYTDYHLLAKKSHRMKRTKRTLDSFVSLDDNRHRMKRMIRTRKIRVIREIRWKKK